MLGSTVASAFFLMQQCLDFYLGEHVREVITEELSCYCKVFGIPNWPWIAWTSKAESNVHLCLDFPKI